MSRTRRLISGASIGYGHQAAVLLMGLWLTPFLLARIGPLDLGLWLVAGQLVGYLGLIELGVIAMLPREVALLSAQASGTSELAIGRLIGRVRRIVRCACACCAGSRARSARAATSWRRREGGRSGCT